jgi:hypothetical protein
MPTATIFIIVTGLPVACGRKNVIIIVVVKRGAVFMASNQCAIITACSREADFISSTHSSPYNKPSARGYNWATLFPGDINTGTWPSRLGESQMRQ